MESGFILGKMIEHTKGRSQGAEEGHDCVPKVDQSPNESGTTPTASSNEHQDGQRQDHDRQRTMDRDALVSSDHRGTSDVSKDVPTVEELLREQHAVREQDRSRESSILHDIREGTPSSLREEPGWVRRATARTRRLLLSQVRPILDEDAEDTSGS